MQLKDCLIQSAVFWDIRIGIGVMGTMPVEEVDTGIIWIIPPLETSCESDEPKCFLESRETARCTVNRGCETSQLSICSPTMALPVESKATEEARANRISLIYHC
jgi:hypothetical protein